ncbi:hypothetical protein [Akkermansia sp. BIOML-A39]|uniref:hypothetical protein n=1 Tax=Akkermansia sp. BIOML-A39 TaxID=2584595 RepID=UPI001F02F371|nr:hypothetical protein [Akkermansia sp. BIOML-A39]
MVPGLREGGHAPAAAQGIHLGGFLLTRVEAPWWKALRSARWRSSGESSPALKEMRFMPTAWGGASGLRGGFVM